MSETLTVTIWPDAEAIAEENSGGDGAVVFHDVDYVSLVNQGTFGPPALVAPDKKNPGDPPKARPGDEVLYVNTSLVPLFKIERNGG